jgi:hypothetical protein
LGWQNDEDTVQYSQITDHIHTLTPSQKGAQQMVGGRHVGSHQSHCRSRSRISGESTDLLLLLLAALLSTWACFL